MKTNFGQVLLMAAAMARLSAASLEAAETAVVKGDIVNVRAQPSIFSEVLTQVKQGDTVTLLEEITLEKPKADEPAKWARIQMPTHVAIWVFASYVDPAHQTVTARRLNLRAGPGENHSVVGVLERDAKIKEIRATDNWVQIETPPEAYAFVAADLIAKPSPAEKPAVAGKPVAPPPPPPATPPAAPVVEPVKAVPAPAPVVATPAPKPAVVPPAPALASPPPLAIPPPIAPPRLVIKEPPPKRIVSREGVVYGVDSIQAPTYFELRSTNTGIKLDYLLSPTTNIVLKNFKGKRVFVTGEESMDTRWTNTPVLKIITLQVAPDAAR